MNIPTITIKRLKTLLYVFILASLVTFYLGFKIQEAENESFARGYRSGTHSSMESMKNQACVAWLFETNLMTAKKRICKG